MNSKQMSGDYELPTEDLVFSNRQQVLPLYMHYVLE